MSDAIWYYSDAGKQAGPVDQATLEGMIRSGQLAAGTPVWRAGMAGWQAWESLPELAAARPQPPATWQPAAPPAAQPGWQQPGAQPGWQAPAGAPPYGGYPGAQAGAMYPKASLGARFVAMLVDGLIFAVPGVIFIVGAVFAGKADNGALAAILGVLGGLIYIWAVVYAFIKDGRPNGQSIGKKMMDLMVVHLPTNQPCSKGQSAGRCGIMLLLNMIPYVGWLIEPIVAMAASDGRRLGDKAANTQVIAVSAYRR
jgi:uncharacterized RDD family membrane protein YckC